MLTMQDALEMAHLCPEDYADPDNEVCQKCPLLEPDDGGYGGIACCDHFRAIADAINDLLF